MVPDVRPGLNRCCAWNLNANASKKYKNYFIIKNRPTGTKYIHILVSQINSPVSPLCSFEKVFWDSSLYNCHFFLSYGAGRLDTTTYAQWPIWQAKFF
jgi:hypothetical protein